MSDTVIKVENLSKRYVIGHQVQNSNVTLRDAIADGARSLTQRIFNFNQQLEDPKHEEFWALRDVSFEIKQGDRVGIIGRNGAGKSTLLKILSRITEPTSGKVSIKGMVSSLLEVGTGFHPELTGRENIFLNGSILGMSRAEIKKKFDEIVDFAEVEKFLDTPVKHYSSGMYVRLAFAVAAHLEPEILIVDEVLAVGDTAFQKKCLGKMEDASNEGRTIVFVSHQMSMISSLCNKAILLKQGKITNLGCSSDVVLSYYYSNNSSPAYIDFTKANQRVGDDYAELLECYVKNIRGEIITEGDFDDEIIIGMRYKVLLEKKFEHVYPYPNCNVFSGDGTHVFYTTMPNNQIPYPKAGEYIAEFSIPSNFLNSGTYFVGLALSTCDNGVKVHFYEQNALCFQIKENLDKTLYDTRNGWSGVLPGVVHPQLSWKLQAVSPSILGLEYPSIHTSLQMEEI